MSELKTNSGCLLAFIDETGEEHFKDPCYPLFGFGGCAIMAGDYKNVIIDPWVEIKERFFGGREFCMHASEMNKPSRSALQAIGDFFAQGRFIRFAAILKNTTKLNASICTYQAATWALMKRIEDIARWQPMTNIVMIFEASDRTDHLADYYFPHITMSEASASGVKDIPIQLLRMQKKSLEPGLEVADFITHAAGTRTHARMVGRNTQRRDFHVTFEVVNKRLQSFMEVDAVDLTDNRNVDAGA